MGIQGLHKGLAFATKKTTLRDFRGQTLAVDSSSWLHRSVYSVSERYVEGMECGRIDQQVIRASARYVISRCEELLGPFQIAKVVLVMDGKRCPLKAETNGERESRRQANLKEARDFKCRGWNDKAEEKYKMCIKIKDELTYAVMKEVSQAFRGNNRVELVWSPYEADAQLAKLCVDGYADAVITEDSDVLVYSAAARCIFSVIFKLDRRSGSCDVISMEWLLAHQQTTAVTGKKAPSALETLLLTLANREARRPGFGARLFVQGCVLAGCDYAPNKLTNIGLVNAFKLVRDNASRNDSVRFRKILESIPGKSRTRIDIEEYELNLAKSETVFYYHIVKHQDKITRPLCEPRTSEPEDGAPHQAEHHFPLMQRFGEDWSSFLGETNDHVEAGPPVNVILFNPCKPKARVPAIFAFAAKKSTSVHNPYIKAKPTVGSKRPREEDRPPLGKMDPNEGRATQRGDFEKISFAKFARTEGSDSPKDVRGSNISSAQAASDPRYVKRHFSSQDDRTRRVSGGTRRFERHSTSAVQDVAGNFFGRHKPIGATVGFDYAGTNEHNVEEILLPANEQGDGSSTADPSLSGDSLSEPQSLVDNPTEGVKSGPPIVFDLTESNSDPLETSIDESDDNDSSLNNYRPARVSLDNSISVPPVASLGLGCTLEDAAVVPTRSKYFSGRDGSEPPRRVSHGPGQAQRKSTRTPQAKRPANEADEFIESPDDTKQFSSHLGVQRAGTRNSLHQWSSQPMGYAKKISGRAQSGPLIDGFRKQQLMAPMGQAGTRHVGHLRNRVPSASQGARQSNIFSHFTVVKKTPPPAFNELKYNTNQTEEDFLWNTP